MLNNYEIDINNICLDQINMKIYEKNKSIPGVNLIEQILLHIFGGNVKMNISDGPNNNNNDNNCIKDQINNNSNNIIDYDMNNSDEDTDDDLMIELTNIYCDELEYPKAKRQFTVSGNDMNNNKLEYHIDNISKLDYNILFIDMDS